MMCHLYKLQRSCACNSNATVLDILLLRPFYSANPKFNLIFMRYVLLALVAHR